VILGVIDPQSIDISQALVDAVSWERVEVVEEEDEE
jgi:hypothetical protein